MNWLDFVILLPLLAGVFSGFRNGLIGEVASLAGLVLGIWGAIHFSGWTAGLMSSLGVETVHLQVIAFLITFLVITILIQMIAGLVNRLLEKIFLGRINRIFGIAAGVAKALLFVSVLLFTIDALDNRSRFIPEKARENSLFYKRVADLVPSLMPFLHIDKIRGDRELPAEEQIS